MTDLVALDTAGDPSKWPVWVTVAVAVVLAIVTTSEKVGGALARWVQSRRALAIAADDADIAEMRRQIAYLQQQLNWLYDELNARDVRINQLYADVRKRDELIYQLRAELGGKP